MAEAHETIGNNVIPSNYSLVFDTDMKAFKYRGSARIKVSIKRPASRIVMHANELSIASASARDAHGTERASVSFDKQKKQMTLSFGRKLAGNALIAIEFQGVNNNGMYGFYRSVYTRNGKEEYLLSTQFEPADAREAFPCFDEPAFKATFDITIIADEGYEALSNMPAKSRSTKAGRTATSFARTPLMSTYLVYLGVGKFDRISTSLGKLRISVLSVPGKKALCSMALQYAKRFVAFYERYFGIRYPLPKVDLIAIPDFSAGAMENWGAITFRETALLGTEKDTPIGVQQQIAETVAHELAHQWFGDLVTMEWWNDLWLNESFATFMSYKAMDGVYPKWNMKEQYINDVVAVAFAADQLKSTHPISVHVSTAEEINGIFDEISYQKGGTVLHMLEEYAGSEAFRQGLHRYLEAHKYGNATKHELWGAIGAEAKGSGARSVPRFASYWIDEPGYPIVSVDRLNQGSFRLEQHRFTISGKDHGSAQAWPIPIYYVDGSAKPKRTFMDGRSLSISTSGRWVKLNYGQHYLYRTEYPKEVLDKIGQMTKSGRLPPMDAWGVENDLFALMRSSASTINEYMDFVGKYCMDAKFPLNDNLAAHFGWLTALLYTKSAFKEIEPVQRRYFSGVLKKLGWRTRAGEPSTDTMLRGAAIRILGILGDAKVTSWAAKAFSDYVEHGKLIDPNLRGAAYYTVAWNGNAKTFDRFVSMYRKAIMPDEKIRLLTALGMFRSHELARRALDFSMSKDVRLQDSIHLPAVLSSNPMHQSMLLDWTLKNWKMLQKMYVPGAHMLDRYVENMSFVSSAAELARIRAFFSRKSNMRGDMEKAYKETIERIEANIALMERNAIK